MAPGEYHEPVLPAEILDLARPVLSTNAGTSTNYVDGTLGDGGHSRMMLQAFPAVRVLGVDRDPEMLARARRRLTDEGLADRVQFQRANFRELPGILDQHGVQADFVLLDLGVSMFHFRGAGRGFSYGDDVLDMRLSPELEESAADLVNRLDQAELQRIFQQYGEEPYSGRIARVITENRPISGARELAELVRRATVGAGRPAAGKATQRKTKQGRDGGERGGRIHPSTRVFQALRIAVNDEFGAIESALRELPQRLAPGGRLAVISFHSLEDRLVKEAFREIGVPAHQRRAAEAEFRIVTRKPVVPGHAETEHNPAARSAKLRCLERAPIDR